MKNKTKGFTLIELLVVISIMGVLAALISANLAGVRARARDSKRKADLEQVKKALRLYYNDFQSYPAGSGGSIAGCGNGTVVCDWGTGGFEANSAVYMSNLPKDPLPNPAAGYRYTQDIADTDTFCLLARLENVSDDGAATSQTRCSDACSGTTVNTLDYAVCAD